ncbi:alanine dehydrogenase [Paraburkholderia dipogonis]|uniref:Alanine dehydrogenase n=1 Tax=Paraburkholderia dipogonis TaxID=1211383 RepID=A0A4Y8MR61_9BURK|nr:alanine dehydrogenase [Paraburkholderia dipogonis]TFE39825.1 alanine dehydrogenase [Paraburkholderia dipogonis]
MKIAVPKEIKTQEYRVGLTPVSVAELVRHGHSVAVEKSAGEGSGIADSDYVKAGASIQDSVERLWKEAELIVKVKEPQAIERARLSRGQILFTYLHLAADADQTADLIRSGATCIAYETVTSRSGGLPLLTPMSEVAGRLAPQAGARCLEKSMGGRGVLLGGVPGVPPGEVLILGGGVSGTHAATIALGMGARVTVVDRSADVLKRLTVQFGSAIQTVFSVQAQVEELLERADLVIGCVLLPGAAAPKLIKRDMLARMKPGSVIVDVAIDQGGCCETSRPTTHDAPTYVVDGVVHYCVANMPGAVARTSTFALNNATLPFVVDIANKGWKQALLDDVYLRPGLNVHEGRLTCKPVGDALGIDSWEVSEVLAA